MCCTRVVHLVNAHASNLQMDQAIWYISAVFMSTMALPTLLLHLQMSTIKDMVFCVFLHHELVVLLCSSLQPVESLALLAVLLCELKLLRQNEKSPCWEDNCHQDL